MAVKPVKPLIEIVRNANIATALMVIAVRFNRNSVTQCILTMRSEKNASGKIMLLIVNSPIMKKKPIKSITSTAIYILCIVKIEPVAIQR